MKKRCIYESSIFLIFLQYSTSFFLSSKTPADTFSYCAYCDISGVNIFRLCAMLYMCVCVSLCVAAKMSSSWCRRWHTHFANCTHFGAFMWPVGRSRKVCQLPQGRRSKRVAVGGGGKGCMWHTAVQKRVSVLLMARVECESLSVCACVLESVSTFSIVRHGAQCTGNRPVYIYCCPDLANIMASSGCCRFERSPSRLAAIYQRLAEAGHKKKKVSRLLALHTFALKIKFKPVDATCSLHAIHTFGFMAKNIC